MQKFEISISCWIKMKDKFLLHKRANNDNFGAGKWSIVGGKVEEGETILEALKREVFEEAGIEIDENSIRIIKDYLFEVENGERIVLSCLADYKSGNTTGENKNSELKWFTISELENLEYPFETTKEEIEIIKKIIDG